MNTFTDRTRSVLVKAREQAIEHDHDYVGTEHILLGLLSEGRGVAIAVLQRLKLDLAPLRLRIEENLRPAKRPGSHRELPYTSRAKKVLELAMEEARALGNPYVGTEHLLIGLLAEGRGIAAQVLTSFGVTLDAARRCIASVLETADEDSEDYVQRRRPARPSAPFTLSLDDSSDSSIYEQIIAQIREAVATGGLRPHQRLPTVRRLADELDIAPGTVARAYGELERLGVIVTEGARGTRVAEPARTAPPPSERLDTLTGLLRPVAVAAFHFGATASELRAALDRAMEGVLRPDHSA